MSWARRLWRFLSHTDAWQTEPWSADDDPTIQVLRTHRIAANREVRRLRRIKSGNFFEEVLFPGGKP